MFPGVVKAGYGLHGDLMHRARIEILFAYAFFLFESLQSNRHVNEESAQDGKCRQQGYDQKSESEGDVDYLYEQ